MMPDEACTGIMPQKYIGGKNNESHQTQPTNQQPTPRTIY